MSPVRTNELSPQQRKAAMQFSRTKLVTLRSPNSPIRIKLQRSRSKIRERTRIKRKPRQTPMP